MQACCTFELGYDSSVDPGLQASLERLDAAIRLRLGMQPEHAAAGILDLKHLRLAMIHPDRIEYAASIPKIGILLAWFEKHGTAAIDPAARHWLALMAKASDNEAAAHFSREWA